MYFWLLVVLYPVSRPASARDITAICICWSLQNSSAITTRGAPVLCVVGELCSRSTRPNRRLCHPESPPWIARSNPGLPWLEFETSIIFDRSIDWLMGALRSSIHKDRRTQTIKRSAVRPLWKSLRCISWGDTGITSVVLHYTTITEKKAWPKGLYSFLLSVSVLLLSFFFFYLYVLEEARF